ncbi:MAG: hypothetical protein CVV41_11455 [Candidatus Riflebacteria bacterium HGW-Riflebacteria-1]|nr:MAG: hypothetical protein CVV41_11455 [Candidatus Riflebacteria bacterium HGW-Riflebacteria-1]
MIKNWQDIIIQPAGSFFASSKWQVWSLASEPLPLPLPVSRKRQRLLISSGNMGLPPPFYPTILFERSLYEHQRY